MDGRGLCRIKKRKNNNKMREGADEVDVRLKGEGVIKGGVQFAGNSKERARGGDRGVRSVESNDQSAGPRCVFVRGGGGCHGNEYSSLNRAHQKVGSRCLRPPRSRKYPSADL